MLRCVFNREERRAMVHVNRAERRAMVAVLPVLSSLLLASVSVRAGIWNTRLILRSTMYAPLS